MFCSGFDVLFFFVQIQMVKKIKLYKNESNKEASQLQRFHQNHASGDMSRSLANDFWSEWLLVNKQIPKEPNLELCRKTIRMSFILERLRLVFFRFLLVSLSSMTVYVLGTFIEENSALKDRVEQGSVSTPEASTKSNKWT